MKWFWTIATIAAAACVWGVDDTFLLRAICCILLLGSATEEAKKALAT